MSWVIDTNVLVVANRKHAEASLECVSACVRVLREARKRMILLDQGGEILREYRRHCSYAGQPGAGDAFFKWLWDRQANPRHCQKVPLTPHPERGYEEFPEDPGLQGFDRSDRKFVAVALASKRDSEVLNATDTGWWNYKAPLERNGVRIQFLCQEAMPGSCSAQG